VREDGRLVRGKEWKETVYNREEWKKLLRTARIVTFYMCQWNEQMKTLPPLSLSPPVSLSHNLICTVFLLFTWATQVLICLAV